MDDPCNHSVRVDSLCALCGAEVSMDDTLVPALHLSDRVFQTSEEALKIQKRKNRKLDRHRKMILILDIDQTILHATLNPVECDFTFTLFSSVFYVTLRPNLQCFLEKVSRLFEIHIYTMGTRDYAAMICKHIDPDGRFFGERIVSRSENFNLHKKSIDRISCISDNVVILDDREDVWDYSRNLVLIRPFWVRDRIDINDPNRIPLYLRNISTGANSNVPSEINHSVASVVDLDIKHIEDQSSVDPAIVLDGLNKKTADKEIPSRSTDDELKAVYKILKRLHTKYFKTGQPVSSILRLRFMKNVRVASHPNYFPVVLFSGIKLDLENPTFVLEDEELARRCKVKNVRIGWLYECIYRRKMVLIKDYLIEDYSEVDEYEEDLLKDLLG